MVIEKFAEEQVVVLGPVVDKLLAMMGAARNAFNRHSRTSLEELRSLHGAVSQELPDRARQLQSLGAPRPGKGQPGLAPIQEVLGHLGNIAENIGQCADPIEQKIRGAVLFSDKAVIQANFLFDQHLGMIRSVLDIIKTDNDFLKKYVLTAGRKLGEDCVSFATEHETRMIEGLCLPQAAPIFLALLDQMRHIAQHEVEIAALLV